MSEQLVICKEAFNNYVKEKKRARDKTLQWPNSFGHGFSTGQVEACMELEQMVKVKPGLETNGEEP